MFVTSRLSRRFAAAAAALVLVTAPLAACSGDDSGSDSASATATPTTVSAALDRVASATADQTSVTGTLRTEVAGEGDVEGTFGFDFTSDGLEAEFTLTQDGEEFVGVLTPTALFVGGASLGGGSTFLRIPLDESNEAADRYLDLVRGFTNGGDLGAAVDLWRSIGDLTEDGTEAIDGVETTRYVGTFDPSAPPAGASQEVTDLYSAAGAAGATSVETTLWIGPDGLPVRVQTVSTGENASTTTIDYDDWGAAVDIEVPSGDGVLDLSTLTG